MYYLFICYLHNGYTRSEHAINIRVQILKKLILIGANYGTIVGNNFFGKFNFVVPG